MRWTMLFHNLLPIYVEPLPEIDDEGAFPAVIVVCVLWLNGITKMIRVARHSPPFLIRAHEDGHYLRVASSVFDNINVSF